MSPAREWTYYQQDYIQEDVPRIYYRKWRGVEERLDRQLHAWIPIERDYLTHYLATGEVGIDKTTRSAIEEDVGFQLPDDDDV